MHDVNVNKYVLIHKSKKLAVSKLSVGPDGVSVLAKPCEARPAAGGPGAAYT